MKTCIESISQIFCDGPIGIYADRWFGYSPPMESRLNNTVSAELAATEVDLVALLKKIETKDRGAFNSFYDLTVKKVYGYAMRITQQHGMAEEVVSDVYMRVWQKASNYDLSRGNVIAWLIIMCRSNALDALRRVAPSTKYPALVNLEDINLEQAVESQGDQRQPQDILHSAERSSKLYNALSQLDENQRQLLSLAYFRGFSHSQLAAFTQTPIGTVKTQLRRGVEKLKNIMSDNGAENGTTGGSGE